MVALVEPRGDTRAFFRQQGGGDETDMYHLLLDFITASIRVCCEVFVA